MQRGEKVVGKGANEMKSNVDFYGLFGFNFIFSICPSY